jgi:hypothetical protein
MRVIRGIVMVALGIDDQRIFFRPIHFVRMTVSGGVV